MMKNLLHSGGCQTPNTAFLTVVCFPNCGQALEGRKSAYTTVIPLALCQLNKSFPQLLSFLFFWVSSRNAKGDEVTLCQICIALPLGIVS